MSFDSAKRVDKTEERRELAMMLSALGAGRESAFVGVPPLPMKTKTLNEECVRTVLQFLTVEKEGCVEMFFGSFATMMQAMPELRRIPGDIDIQLSVGKQEAELIVSELFARLEKIDKTLRIDPKKPTIIETSKNGRWERAVDSHYAGEPPEDGLSPKAPIPFFQKAYTIGEGGTIKPLELPERTREQKLIDTLDCYIISKTSLESARLHNESKTIIEQWETLLKRYVELWEDEIDFDKLEVRHTDVA